MAKDTRELLAEAAPRPRHSPDFEQLWERGRRQRRTAQLAGTVGTVVLLVTVGAGLVQLAGPGPSGVPVVDAPDSETHEALRGRGQQFGQAETPEGVSYAGRLRVGELPMRPDGEPRPDQDQVCVALQIGEPGERHGSEGCGLLERSLEHDETMLTHSRGRTHSGVAAWSPREVDHAVWELRDTQLRVEASSAPGLPGSVFVAVVDGQLEQDTRVVMYDAEGAQLDQFTLEIGASFPAEDLADPDGDTVAASDRWMTESEKDATAQEAPDQGTWIASYFYPSDDSLADPELEDTLEPRWKRLSDDVLDLDREGQLREALAALAGPPPAGMSDGWSGSGYQLGLETVELDGAELVLDFDALHAPANGTTHGMAMQAQVEATALHYYPEADSICVLDEGQPAIWLHDMQGCPSRDLPQ